MAVNDPKEICSELREYAERYSDPTNELMRDAADTIEELDRRNWELNRESTGLRRSWWEERAKASKALSSQPQKGE